MIDPNTLKESLIEATQNVPAIKKRHVLVTDDEMVDFLGEHKAGNKPGDNILLLAVLPAYGGFGEEDASGAISYMQFFVLEKVDYKSMKNQDEYLAVFQRTLEAARLFLVEMFNINLLNCSKEELQYEFQIRPVSRKAQCNGYEIQIDSKAYTDEY